MTDYNLIGNKIVEAKQHPLGYSAMELYEIPPNRFDPFEALDTFLACIREMEEHTVGFGGDIETMRNQVYALRAYITGMEQS